MSDKTKYCKHCGKTIPEDAVVCAHCGRQVEVVGGKDQPIIINNSASSSASAAATNGRVRRHYNKLLDIILCIFLFPIWEIWILIRPKYE